MTAMYAAVLATPPGPLSVVVEDELLVAAGFTADPAQLVARLDPHRRGQTLRRRRDLGEVTRALSAYFAGDVTAPDLLAVQQSGTPYQQAVWAALRTVPAGGTVSYSELAALAGTPSAVRAVGTACGRNLIAPVVPCHRIVRRDGGLGGYYYGLAYKQWLLAHEHRAAAGDALAVSGSGSARLLARR